MYCSSRGLVDLSEPSCRPANCHDVRGQSPKCACMVYPAQDIVVYVELSRHFTPDLAEQPIRGRRTVRY